MEGQEQAVEGREQDGSSIELSDRARAVVEGIMSEVSHMSLDSRRRFGIADGDIANILNEVGSAGLDEQEMEAVMINVFSRLTELTRFMAGPTDPVAERPEGEAHDLAGAADGVVQEASGMTFRTDRKYGVSDENVKLLEQKVREMNLSDDEKEAVIAMVRSRLREERERMQFREAVAGAAAESEGSDRDRLMSDAMNALEMERDDPNVAEVRLDEPEEKREDQADKGKKKGFWGRLFG